jgi:hypothetical protein
VVLDSLASWSDHPDNGVKHFSGAAVYRKSFDFTPVVLSDPTFKPVVALDLGNVAVMAAAKVNGKDAGVLWKPPYRVDISGLFDRARTC